MSKNKEKNYATVEEQIQCYQPAKSKDIHIGRIKRVKLISNCICSGPRPLPEDEVEQHLTICSDGRVFFCNYVYGNGEEQKYERKRRERHDISESKANYILATIGAYFEEVYEMDYAYDCGNWNLEITNEKDEQICFTGPLISELKYRKEGLSNLLRDYLEMSELLGFDGNVRKEIFLSEGEYIFVKVSFGNKENTYCYICGDKMIREEDKVLVPVGFDNQEKTAIVQSVEVYSKENAPYPVERCKHIIKRINY